MSEEHDNGEFKYKPTDWRRFVEYRFDELKEDFQEVTRKIDAIVTTGVITPPMLDQKLKDQKESCAVQFKGMGNPDSNGLRNGWSLAKWGIKEYGIWGFQAIVIVGLFVLLMKAEGIIP